ncbi:MAG: DUF2807 domain-containing protein [Bacteroidota bacterium]
MAQILRALFKTIGFIWKPLLIFFSVVLGIVLVLTWISGAITFVMGMPLADYILPNQPWLVGLGYTNLLMVVGIPLLILLLLLVRIWTKFRLNNYWRAGLGTFWLLNIFTFIGIGTYTARQFHAGLDVNGEKTALSVVPDTLYLQSSTADATKHYLFKLFGDDALILTDDYLLVDDVDIDIVRSETGQFQEQLFFFSRGSNKAEAKDLIEQIEFSVVRDGNTWTLPTQIRIPKGVKYRGQGIRYRIEVPEGKSIQFDKGINRSLSRFQRDNRLTSCRRCHQHTWTMTEEGLVRPKTVEERQTQQSFTFSPYSKLQLEGRMEVEILKGRDEISVEAPDKQRDNIQFDELSNTLYITAKGKSNAPTPIVRIMIPELAYLRTQGTRDITIRGFEQATMQIEHEGRYDLEAFVSIDSLIIMQTESSDIELRGEGKYLSVTAEKSKINAARYAVETAKVVGTNRSKFTLSVQDSCYEALDKRSTIRYQRAPLVVQRDTLR